MFIFARDEQKLFLITMHRLVHAWNNIPVMRYGCNTFMVFLNIWLGHSFLASTSKHMHIFHAENMYEICCI